MHNKASFSYQRCDNQLFFIFVITGKDIPQRLIFYFMREYEKTPDTQFLVFIFSRSIYSPFSLPLLPSLLPSPSPFLPFSHPFSLHFFSKFRPESGSFK